MGDTLINLLQDIPVFSEVNDNNNNNNGTDEDDIDDDVGYLNYNDTDILKEYQANEALFFKVFDSQSEVYENVNVPLHTAHTAFQIPGSNDATPPRESIECRCLVHFGSESKL